MPDLNEAAAAIANVDTNRDATPEDAVLLGAIHDRLVDQASNVKDKQKAFMKSFSSKSDDNAREAARLAYEGSVTRYHDTMAECWITLNTLPKGVTCGNATRHTVALQHYGGHLTSDFGIRLTVADAKAANKAAWGK